MGGGDDSSLTTNNEPRSARHGKPSRRKMTGFDVRKVDRRNGAGTPIPRRLATPTPTMFSDLVDILHNGQRQGLLVFNSGSGLSAGISTSARPPPNFNSIPLGGRATPKTSPSLTFTPTFVPSGTDRAFFSSSPNPTSSSPFPFDRRIHQQQQQHFRPANSPFRATPTSPTFPSHINTTPFFNNPPPSSFPVQTNTPVIQHQQTVPGTIVNNNNNNALVEALSFASSTDTVAPRPEKLIIHVVEQQKLGKLKTSNGPVEQTRQQVNVVKRKRNKSKKNKRKVQ